MWINGDGAFRILSQNRIHVRFQGALWAKQLNRTIAHLTLQCIHRLSIVDRIVFIGFNISGCQMAVVNEFFAILTLPTIVLNVNSNQVLFLTRNKLTFNTDQHRFLPNRANFTFDKKFSSHGSPKPWWISSSLILIPRDQM